MYNLMYKVTAALVIIALFFPIVSLGCTLLDGDPPSKPKPSLTKCYRYNTNSCCVSAHDAQILSDYGSLLSGQCQREYDYLEDYYCIGCNALEATFVDNDLKNVYLCRAYAENIWGTSLLLPTTNFDNCGMNTFWRDDNSATIVPSGEWANAFQFFGEVKPSYYADYNIVILDNSNSLCYSDGIGLVLGLAFLVIWS